ncbi:hypothetical protein BDN71DRAFT_1449298 [Pleurotus eryngii]|uniref:J domain-containing protein n=1 Tax=Pleurotus eryngii TaxID=5323 RepID=A0A9P6DEL0_PLEER|nr:hypothetical protein BDN71DRAFT_1449298 [Pleurotus eryngii]
MVSGTTHALLSFAGWSVIPDMATSRLLQFVVNPILFTYFKIPPPSPQILRSTLRYRLTFAFVVLSYLAYSLVQGAKSIERSFYEMMRVSVDVDEAGLKAAFKGFAKRYHPDRPGVGRDGEEVFMRVRTMFEALKDPVVRFAYDRFGPDVLKWENLSTEREYLRHGLIYNSGYHIVTFLGLQFWSAIGDPSPVAFWRYMLYLSILVSEVSLILGPSPMVSSSFTSAFPDPAISPAPQTLLHIIFPQRVAYQHILFLHHLFVFLTIALSRVAPMLFPSTDITSFLCGKGGKMFMDKLKAIASVTDKETSIMLHTELHSAHLLKEGDLDADRPTLSKMRPRTELDDDVMEALTREMRDMIIEANVRKETGPIHRAWKDAIARGRSAARSAMSMITKDRPLDSEEGKKDSGDADGRKGLKDENKLPSPRPSPPPPVSLAPRPTVNRRASGYVRARSVSY